MDNFALQDILVFIEGLKLDQLRTIHSINLIPQLWLKIYLIYISLLCIWYIYRIQFEDEQMRRHFFLGFFTTVIHAILSTINVPNTHIFLFSRRFHIARTFRTFHHFMSLTATVGIVGFVVGSISGFTLNPISRRSEGLLYLTALTTLALSVGLECDYCAILLYIWLYLILIALSFRYVLVAKSAIWVLGASSFGLLSVFLAVASRGSIFQQLVIGNFVVENRIFIDSAHFIYGMAMLCFAKVAVISNRCKLESIQDEKVQLKKRR